ncbi:hypothetical protein [uncultured Algimonas sp.]|uniref:hypothetical protein n=1 Tax=uncultured Algimonas sp. TaxID=1547920 RepID=UPI0026149C95|nr:hypothetical protein [uncultured Algimonas sp.]
MTRYTIAPKRPMAAVLATGSLLLSACSYMGGITPQEEGVRQHVAVDRFMPASREMRDNIETQELFAQAAFWSHEYELNPSDLEATLKLAAAVRRLGNPARSVEITQTARQIHPRDPYLLAEHAAGLIAAERALDAVPILDQGLRAAPAYARLWSLKGAALDQMEEFDAARQHYGRALQITPGDPNVLTNLGLSHALSGDLRTSETWLRRAVSVPGAGPEVHQNLALVLQLQGRGEEAEREQRLAGLSRGERRLPPAPVPALTPRGTPAQFSGTQPSRPDPQTAATGARDLGQFKSSSRMGARFASPAQAVPQPHLPTQPRSGPYAPGGLPAARLTTTAPNGQAFTSSSQAARLVAGGAPHAAPSQQRAPFQPRPVPADIQTHGIQTHGAQTHGIQTHGAQTYAAQTYSAQGYWTPAPRQPQSVLNSIRQSLQPGPTGPQLQPQSQPQPQPHVVGPALRSPQAAVPGPSQMPALAGQAHPQPGYAWPQSQPAQTRPTPQGRARDRRRR